VGGPGKHMIRTNAAIRGRPSPLLNCMVLALSAEEKQHGFISQELTMPTFKMLAR